MFNLRPSRTISIPLKPGAGDPLAPQLTPGLIRTYMQSRGLKESIVVHAQDIRLFLRAQGVTELGRGGEGAVYFLRGHVVKLTGIDFAPALLREIAHMLHLNPGGGGELAMGDRARTDVPGLLWVYTLSDGCLSAGMRPFDLTENGPRGSTLHDRLHVGPVLPREQVFRLLERMCATLVYVHKRGIIHHDLKPANTYIPGNPEQDPVVFDLGQALWKQNAWGDKWLSHNHNLHYWYNGTYQYMHRARRLAHLCALNIAAGQMPTEAQRAAFEKFVPTPYDDIFSFAYMIRDIVRSRFADLLQIDRKLLREYYQRLMGLKRGPPPVKAEPKSNFLKRMSTVVFKRDDIKPERPLRGTALEPPATMAESQTYLAEVLLKLRGIR
jgi:serine/threonine protein kinase